MNLLYDMPQGLILRPVPLDDHINDTAFTLSCFLLITTFG